MGTVHEHSIWRAIKVTSRNVNSHSGTISFCFEWWRIIQMKCLFSCETEISNTKASKHSLAIWVFCIIDDINRGVLIKHNFRFYYVFDETPFLFSFHINHECPLRCLTDTLWTVSWYCGYQCVWCNRRLVTVQDLPSNLMQHGDFVIGRDELGNIRKENTTTLVRTDKIWWSL